MPHLLMNMFNISETSAYYFLAINFDCNTYNDSFLILFYLKLFSFSSRCHRLLWTMAFSGFSFPWHKSHEQL